MESVDLNNKKEKIIALLDDAEKSGEYSLPVEDFLDVFKKILDDDDLFVKYSNTFAQSMALSVEPESLENFEFDREGYAREITKNIENYLKPAFDAYESASVSEKSKIIEILTLANNKSQSLNTLNFQKYLNSFILEQKKKEEEPDGNYYISTHLDALLSGNEKIVEGEIAPQQFAIEKVGERGERTLMFSEKENFEEILALKKEIEEISDEYKKVFNRVKEAGATKGVTVNFQDLEDKVGSELQKLGDLFKSKQEYFYSLFKEAPQNFLSFSATDSISGYFDSRIFFFKSVRDKVSNDVGFDLSSVSLPEQFNFFEYTKNTSNQDISRTFEFTKKYGPTGFRTFLSLEHGGKEMGDKILALGEKLPPEFAEKLFIKYSEIVDEVGNIGDFLLKSLKEKPSTLLVEETKNHLLKKGKNLLVEYADKAEICKKEECEALGRELEKRLLNIKSSLFLLASACNSLAKEGLLKIEDLADTDLDVVNEVDDASKKEVKRIFVENRPNYPENLLKEVVAEFEEAVDSPKENQTFYILRTRGEIVAFMRLDEMPDGSIYGASFNVRTELRGSSIGAEWLKKIIEEKSAEKVFKIICYKDNPMFEKYKKNFGFEVSGEIADYKNTGAFFYEMERRPIEH